MVVCSIYSPKTVPILWTIFFFYGAAATGRCFLGFSLYSMRKKEKQIKAAIRDKLVKFARSNTQSHPVALWNTEQSRPDNSKHHWLEARHFHALLLSGNYLEWNFGQYLPAFKLKCDALILINQATKESWHQTGVLL